MSGTAAATSLHIGISYNPISGRGASYRAAKDVDAALGRLGVQTTMCDSGVFSASPSAASPLADADYLLIAGGDGTLMAALEWLSRSRVPVYMLPTGNESLFARQFGMTRDPSDVVRCIKRGAVGEHWLAEVNGRLFFTMASLGLDSEVVRSLAARRTGTIRRWSYIAPAVKCMVGHCPPRISLHVDGEPRIGRQDGFLIVANTPQYAMRTAYVPEASSTERCLYARFFPYRTAWGYLRFSLPLIHCFKYPSATYPFICGERFEIRVEHDAAYPIQADGEYVGATPAVVVRSQRTLRVLTPA